MARKILTFEEYVQETDRSEEIEKEITDLGHVEDLEDEVEDSEEEVEVDEASLSGIEFGNDDDIHPTKFKPLVQSLKKNKVKMEVEKEEGEHGYPEVKLTGKRKDIEKVLADVWGPDSVSDYEDYFESVVAEADRAEEIEDEIEDLGEPEDLEDEVIDNDGVPVAESDRAEEIEDEITDLGEPEDLEDEVEDSEEEVEVAEGEDAEEIVEKMVSEMLSEVYGESCKNEAMNYESDDYEDHTIESYMKENAALVAALSTESMREAYTESTEENMKLETFEAVCESMKESYCKKIDEMKESFNVGNVERKGLGGGGM